MYYDNEWQEDYEKRFNGYMMKIINNTFKQYIVKRRKEIAELILNERVNEDMERVETLKGDDDIAIKEDLSPKNLALIVTDKKIYESLKLLTQNESSVIFLSVISKWTNRKIAKELNMHESSVSRTYNKGIKKIRKLLGVDFNDKI